MKLLENYNIYVYNDHLQLYNITLHMKYPRRNHVKMSLKVFFVSHQ